MSYPDNVVTGLNVYPRHGKARPCPCQWKQVPVMINRPGNKLQTSRHDNLDSTTSFICLDTYSSLVHTYRQLKRMVKIKKNKQLKDMLIMPRRRTITPQVIQSNSYHTALLSK